MGELSPPWFWLIAGLALCGAEMFAPGVFLLWIGLAAIGVGLLLFAIPMNLAWTLIVFAALSVAAVFVGRRFYGALSQTEGDATLNRRADQLVGRVVFLETPIVNEEGTARVNDTIWRVRGADLPAGARVRVTGVVNGVVLAVEAA